MQRHPMDNLESAYLCLKNNDIKVCSAFSAFISDVTTETSDDNIGVIVDSLAGVVVLVAAVVAVVLIYKKCQQTHWVITCMLTFFLNKTPNNHGKDGYNRYDKTCKYISAIHRLSWDIFE